MPAYFLSDVHLRLDKPDRGQRFARWLHERSPRDPIVIAGDLCDFWYASRQHRSDPLACVGLRALADFCSCGGAVTVMPGNHDVWLGPLYERVLGVRFVPEPLEVEASGVRVHLVHGHRLGARSLWKSGLETRAFLHVFRRTPAPLARGLEALLEWSDARGRAASDRRHLAIYRHYADQLADRADLVVFGHIHRPIHDTSGRPQLIVLGSWRQGSSYLKIDDTGASLVVDDPQGSSRPS